MPFSQIAERLNVSPGMVRLRYNRLTELGLLRVAAITNPLRLGYNTMALIGLRVDGSRLMEIAGKISKLDEVIYLIVTSGSYDVIAESSAATKPICSNSFPKACTQLMVFVNQKRSSI